MKQTSDRVSRIAAKTMALLKGERSTWLVCMAHGVRVSDVRALAASCLSQDETKGKRKSAKRKKAKA